MPAIVFLIEVLSVLAALASCSTGATITPSPVLPPSPDRLALRPSDVTTGAKTLQSGTFQLDSVPKAWVYVPPQCVGKQCPLVVFLHGAGMTGKMALNNMHEAADTYGLLLLGPSATGPWWNGRNNADMPENKHNVEIALRETFHRVAIDPKRIAVVGECNGGYPAHHWGLHNLDLFSRVAFVSGVLWDDSAIVVSQLVPRTTTAQFYVQESIVGGQAAKLAYQRVKEFRQNGNTVEYVVSGRGHSSGPAEFLFLGRWLSESWQHGSARPLPVVLDSLPVVTVDELTKVTHFLSHFRSEDAWKAGQRQFAREVVVPVNQRPIMLFVDLNALSKAYPSVAADLKAAGLTPHEYDAIRLALVAAFTAENTRQGMTDSSSVLGKNMAFVHAHSDEIEAARRAGLFDWP